MGTKQLCGVKTKAGTPCMRPAGAGTEHVGWGACKLHGGTRAQVKRAAGRPTLEMLVGFDVGDVDPWDALLMCVRITSAEVVYFSQQIAQIEESQVLEGFVLNGQQIKVVNTWLRLRDEAVKNLARYSKMAIDAGVAERQVRVAEQMGDTIAQLVEGILNDLSLTKEQQARVPAIVRRRLALVSGGGATD